MTAVHTIRPTLPPVLDIDAHMETRHNVRVSESGRIARIVVWNLFAHLAANGWSIRSVEDEEEITRLRDPKQAMELIFNLDISWVAFSKNKRHHVVMLVPENGEDVISDWGYATNDSDDFNAAMESYNVERIVNDLTRAR